MTKKRKSKPKSVDVAGATGATVAEKLSKLKTVNETTSTTSNDQTKRARMNKPAHAGSLLFSWPFDRKNLIWFLASVVVIIIGYVFLGQGPYDSVSSMTIGPILLVIGYLILLPVSILVRSKPGN